MSNNNIFDPAYIKNRDQTTARKERSEIKEFLKSPVEKKELERYGSSKPRRVVIRAKIANG